MSLVTRSQLILSQGFETPAGSFHLAGVIKKSSGTMAMRRLERYAIVHVTEGSGSYSDANGYRANVSAGDFLLLFPDIPHQYGPGRGEHWDEFYIVFSGPVFDLWRARGILSPGRPVIPLTPIDQWYDRWRELVDGAEALPASVQLAKVCRLVELLSLAVHQAPAASDDFEPPWLSSSKALLAASLDQEVDIAAIAASVGLSYESFRKRFAAAVGVSPGQYRRRLKIATASELLTTTNMTLKQIAEALGFGDEFHFSHRFKQITGLAPSRYRAGGSRIEKSA